MLKMVYFTLLCSLFFFGLTTAGQESFSMVNLHEPKPILLQALSHTGVPIAVSVNNEDLSGISSSVLMAESWLRTHVLTYFPATQITTIVVANNVVCNKNHEEIWGLVLPSMKNIYYSLVRWGLEKEIKVSTSFSKDCFKNPFFDRFRDDLSENVIKPLLDFLKSSNSTYSVNPPLDFFPLYENTIRLLVASHTESMEKLGFFKGIEVKVLSSSPKGRKPMKRKLISSMASNVVDPFPARPTPLPEIPPSPLHHSIGYSVPAHVVKNPPPYLPPLFPQPAPSPSMSFPFPPESPPAPASIPSNPPPPASIPSNPPPPASIPSNPPPPATIPSSPPHNSIPSSPPPPDFLPSDPPGIFTYPCTPPPTQTAPTPERSEEKGLWCVAKPTVPADTLQEAIDYACGEGGADCEEIKPNGSCYNPDTVVAHASYAFNSYWQKNKKNGGSCSFGGTAMIINADPSFQQCKFILSLN